MVPPPNSIFKVNIDTISFYDKNVFGLRVIIKYWNRGFLATSCKTEHGRVTTHTTKILTVKKGVRFAQGLDLKSIILKGDAKQVYESFENNLVDLSYNGTLLHNVFTFASWFHYFSARYIPCTCNEVANCLAHFAKFHQVKS